MRLTKPDRTEQLLEVALALAASRGWSNMTRDAIAEAAECGGATVTLTLGTMTEIKRSVMRRAVRERCLPVVAEGLSRSDRTARKAPDDLKQEAASWIQSR